MKKINVAEILKDCPNDMELDCTMYDNLYFNKIHDDDGCLYKISCYTIVDEIRTTVNFTEFGTFNTHANSKCVIFPKGKTSWEGFVPPREFKDGDVIVGKRGSIAIYKCIHSSYKEEPYVDFYCGITYDNRIFIKDNDSLLHCGKIDSIRFATEEEKEELFQVIKDNGYTWNSENKTLEKLIKPKFKVGDRVKHISSHTSGIIVKVTDKDYHINYPKGESVYIDFTLEKDYELAPNKFDINTLIPFESKMLARDNNQQKWCPAIWGFYNGDIPDYPYTLIGGSIFKYCIPYEGNEHLLGKTDDCDNFYKIWE